MTTLVADEPIVSSLQQIAAWERAFAPARVAAAFYIAVTALLLAFSYRLAGGHFVYALDDTYINMAMAKQLARHHVWGVTPFAFSGSTSAPLYVALLAGIYWLIGPMVWVPLALSWSFGLASVFVAERMMRPYLGPARRVFALAALVLFVPLFVIGVLGMEHTLHLLLTLLFLERFDGAAGRKEQAGLALLTAAMVGVRYEGALLAGVAAGALMLERRFWRAGVIAGSAAFPVLGYAWFARAHGGYWLPNSIAIKGLRAHPAGANAWMLHRLGLLADHASRGVHLCLLIALLGVAAWIARDKAPRLTRSMTVIAVAGLLHLVLADVGWVFRYEDYLVGAGLVVLACVWPRLDAPQGMAGGLLLGVAALTFGMLTMRTALAFQHTARYSQAIYLQPWQVGRFLAQEYPRGSVALNDIGVASFDVDLHLTDLVGLASADVFALKRKQTYTTGAMDQLTRADSARVAVVYDPWFAQKPLVYMGGPPLPAGWSRVRRWTVAEKEQLGGRTVSFYALSPEEVPELKAKLARFELTLPAGVTVQGP